MIAAIMTGQTPIQPIEKLLYFDPDPTLETLQRGCIQGLVDTEEGISFVVVEDPNAFCEAIREETGVMNLISLLEGNDIVPEMTERMGLIIVPENKVSREEREQFRLEIEACRRGQPVSCWKER
ncbi:hypothetical protein A2Z33_00660 [Candidatus Gottesmanbacteria bacterium RBG_16_52_11]|uniref:Uncharacterized protein n=1 Tax=Candidatus Gottesmanbacteria bacterium RBG_16_52_11 TaxID=1798374 RepID=A0A1F5YMX0_9BACT|nr:MAG: hypothetical protein A2Z33_00660 [Candidatus Gottesmanbacteria bacterium RBG_16_52_11]